MYQSFVRDMLVDPDHLAILEGVIGLARGFEREVVAEGVETTAHGVQLLRLWVFWRKALALPGPCRPTTCRAGPLTGSLTRPRRR